MEDNNEIVFEDAESQDECEVLTSKKVDYKATDPEISDICQKIQSGKIVTTPDFQRQYVWPKEKATRLIESILLEIPLPVVYLAETPDGKKRHVIDGQQRLTSIYSFRTGKFPDGKEFKLGKMTAFPELTGKKFDDLSDDLQEKIDSTGIRLVTFTKDCDPELKFNVFERLNTGAMSLNDQELRNCVYRGAYNDLLKELAADSQFKTLLGLKGAEKRMIDVELVLRFAAFYHQTYLKYKSPIKTFLNEDMRGYQNISEKDAKELRDVFKKAVSLTTSVLGDKAFKRFIPGVANGKDGYWEPKKFNASLYDVLMWSFARSDKNLVMHNLDVIREAYIDLMTSDADFIESIVRSTSSTQMVTRRFKKWNDRLDAILDNQTKQPRCFSRQLKEEMFKKDPTCAICNQAISCVDDAAVDHIEQYWAGGQTIPENARLAHRFCNCQRPKNDVVEK